MGSLELTTVCLKYVRLFRFNNILPVLALVAPCFFVLATSPNRGSGEWFLVALKCVIGAFLSRTIGCIINDVLDADIDSQVARTSIRPIACGEISKKSALLCLIPFILLTVILLATMKTRAVACCLVAAIAMAVYPLTKRFMPLPQVFLGFTLSSSVLVCSLELFNKIPMPSVVIYFGTICWVMGYDTIYAKQDEVDDRKLGVKSAIIFFKDPEKALIRLYDSAILFWLCAQGLTAINSNYVIFLFIAWGLLRIQIRLFKQGHVCPKNIFGTNILVAIALSTAFYLAPHQRVKIVNDFSEIEANH